MAHHHTLVQDFRGQGYRLTPQRDIILRAIHDAEGHFTAEQVYQQVSAHSPAVNLATVYRTLELLCQLGIVCEIDLGRTSREYELRHDRPHHHLVCTQCGATMAFPHDLIEPLAASLRDELGFKADLKHLSVFGLCRHCCDEARDEDREDIR